MQQKKTFIILLLVFSFFMLLPVESVHAADCFRSGSGLLDGSGQIFQATGKCTPELLANYIVALVEFFFRLAIALAVLMIVIGGFQWLIAIGNSSKISNAKDTIQQAIIGLILALTATLLFSQIDKRFTQLQSPNVTTIDPIEVKCDFSSLSVCIGYDQCQWKCADGSIVTNTGGSCQDVTGKGGHCEDKEEDVSTCVALIQGMGNNDCRILTPEQRDCVIAIGSAALSVDFRCCEDTVGGQKVAVPAIDKLKGGPNNCPSNCGSYGSLPDSACGW